MVQSRALHPDFGDYSPDGYGIPYNVVPATQADVDLEFTQYASESDPGPGGSIGTNPVTAGNGTGETAYPFFVGMRIEGGPTATADMAAGDQHGLVLQQGASGCMLFEGWNCAPPKNPPPFQCANGAVFDLTSNNLRPAGWTSADAAGLPIFPGLVKLVEVQAGTITHAIRVTFDTTQGGYIAPATHAAGSAPLGSSTPPMGLRLRLKASVDISSFSAETQIILKAMKKYGVIIADNGFDLVLPGRQRQRLEQHRTGWEGHDHGRARRRLRPGDGRGLRSRLHRGPRGDRAIAPSSSASPRPSPIRSRGHSLHRPSTSR